MGSPCMPGGWFRSNPGILARGDVPLTGRRQTCEGCQDFVLQHQPAGREWDANHDFGDAESKARACGPDEVTSSAGPPIPGKPGPPLPAIF